MLKTISQKALFVLPFLLFLFLRLHLIVGDMSNSDAYRWHRRSDSFSQALLSKNFADTYQRYHPGVTLMWLTTFTEWGIKAHHKITNQEFKTIGNTDGYLLIDSASKIVLVLVLFALLLVQFKYIKTLYDKNVALFFVFVAAIEPYFVGINRWYHLTALEVSLAFCAFLAFVLWSEYNDKRYIVKSGVFFGLALLTKFSTLFVVPVFALIFIYTVIKKKNLSVSFYSTSALTFAITTISTFFAFFPALWVAPIAVLSNMKDAAILSGVGDYLSVVYAESRPFHYYLAVLLFKLSPITLILLAIGLIRSLDWKDRILNFTIFYVVSQLVLLTFSEQKIERYILSFLHALFLIIAVTLSRMSRSAQIIAVVLMLVSSGIAFKNYHPLYSAYYSPAFGGPVSAYKVGLYDDSGEFSARAARYLNTKGRDTLVHVPYNVESFSPYFKGKLTSELENAPGYLVVTSDSRRNANTYGANCPTIDSEAYNNGLRVVTIFNCVYDPILD